MKRPTPAWLSTAVFYEIYPQSFHDSNGDGIGDLPGITAKLDYIADLGCTAIWLNPCFVSPFGDAGYDVADFYQVAPRYGTNDDLVTLFREARRRGLRVCLDFVAGHTSVEHPWFKESCRAEQNRYSNWYIWTNSVWDSGEPGKPMVQGYSERDGNFLPNFFYFQPALNYGYAKPNPAYPWQLPVDHPDVQALREEAKRVLRFWLDLGADGFRVDMAMSLVKNDPDLRETMKFWAEVRAMFDKDYPDAALMSEWSDPSKAILAGFHVDFMLHFSEPPAYTALLRKEKGRNLNPSAAPGHSFFDAAGKGDIREFLDSFLKHYEATRELGFITIPSGNHDIPRLALGRTEEEVFLVFAFIMTMPGIPFIYNGDEIGLRQIEGLPSKEGGYSRTGARTPMQWNREANLGFSTAAQEHLYLPVDGAEDAPTAESRFVPGSLYSRVKELIALRARLPALGNLGEFRPLSTSGYPFVYARSSAEERYVLVNNPAQFPAQTRFTLPDCDTLKLVWGTEAEVTRNESDFALSMPPLSFAVYQAA